MRSMTMYKTTAVISILLLLGNCAYGTDFTKDVSLDNDYNATQDLGQTPNVNINGNGYSINGNEFSGLQLEKGNNNINVYDAGKYTLEKTDNPTENSILVINENGERQYYNISETASVNGFKSSKGGSFIYNSNYGKTTEMTIKNSVIKNNSSSKNNGGAVYNYSTGGDFTIKDSYITGNSIKNPASTSSILGGAIYNESRGGTFNIVNSYITNNSIIAESSNNIRGGAVYSNYSNTIIKNSYFGNNTASGTGAQGAAVYLDGSNLSHEIINTVFENNKTSVTSTSFGGALLSYGNLIIDNSLFLSNKIILEPGNRGHNLYGGAIYKAYGDKFIVKNSTFEDNTIESNNGARVYGAAIYAGSNENTIENSKFINNRSNNQTESAGVEAAGGAIYLNGDSLKVNNSTFDSNIVNGNQNSFGGAIATTSPGKYIEINNSSFLNNQATSSSEKYTGSKGGAVYTATNTVLNINNSNFENNLAKADTEYSSFYGGGAIYVSQNSTATISDTSFSNNKTVGPSTYGGAIFNAKDATLNIISNKKDVVFSGNQSGIDENTMTSNAIYNNEGIINLNAGNTKIIFNDRISSQNAKGAININKTGEWDTSKNPTAPDGNKIPTDAPTGGTIVLNNDMTDYKGEVNLHGGTLSIGANGTFFEKAASFNVNNVSNLDLANGIVRDYNLGNVYLNANLNTAIDVDLVEQKADNIKYDNLTVNNDAKININRVNVTADANAESANVIITEDENLQDVITLDPGTTTALGKIYKYNVNYDTENATMSFLRSGLIDNGGGGNGNGNNNGNNPNRPSYNDLNPAVMTGSVAAQLGGYMGMVDTYNNAFTNMDIRMLHPSKHRIAQRQANRYAIVDKKGKSIYSTANQAGTWVRPFAAYDNVGLKNGPKVNSFSYGTFIGGDSEVYNLKNGAEGVISTHISYLGSHQSFAGNSIYQNGGNLGITGTYYKGNFFSGLTINAGASVAEARTSFGHEDFPMFMAGIANKTGYNFEFKEGKFIIQPSVLLSYTFVNTFDYTNAAGVRINSDPLHAIQISPNMKFAFNTKNNWQPYLTVGMNWNLMNESQFTANMTTLPQLSVKPYVQYGVGIQKTIKDNFMAFAQCLIRNGGRNGILASIGFKYTFGGRKRTPKQQTI